MTFEPSHKILGKLKHNQIVLFTAKNLQNLFELFLLQYVLGEFI